MIFWEVLTGLFFLPRKEIYVLSGTEILEIMRVLDIRSIDVQNETGITMQTLRNIINGNHKTSKVVWYALISYFQKVYTSKYYEDTEFRESNYGSKVLQKLENL